MTDYYDADDLNSRHAVSFTEPDNEPNFLYYYDFDSESWVKCYSINRLPYDLHSFRLDNDKVVVTCSGNSYRLADTLPETTDKEFMRSEKEWRDALTKGSEFDFYTPDGWVKGVVRWTKADIVPGVIVGGPRERPSVNKWMYIYKEDKRFAKSCTHTEPITQEELDAEHDARLKAHQEYEEIQKTVKEWSQKIGMKVPIKYKRNAYSGPGMEGKTGFIDILPYYQSLKRCPQEITKERIADVQDPKYREDILNCDCDVGIMGLVSNISIGYDVIYTSHCQTGTSDKGIILDKLEADGYFNIKVYNATFAYLMCGEEFDDNKRLDMEELPNNVFTFTDITYENPLFPSYKGSALKIITDGKSVDFDALWIQPDPRYIMNRFENSYAVSHFPKHNRVLLAGHLWQPTMSFDYNDLIYVPNDDYHIALSKLQNWVKDMCNGRDKSHGYQHMMRVVQNAREIFDNTRAPGSDLDGLITKYGFEETWGIVEVAALLHDINDHKYTEGFTADLKPHIEKILPNRVGIVMDIIENISYSKEIKMGLKDLGEFQILRNIVSDADKLDALGAIGIERCIIYTVAHHEGPDLSSDALHEHIVHHARAKLLNLHRYCRTEYGKEKAIELTKYVADFL